MQTNKSTESCSHFLDKFLNPKSIAIYGANENLLQNMGSQQLLNMIDNGYKGRIYPIHPKLESVWTLKAYKKIADLPEIPDLAIVILPTQIVPQIFHEIGQKGVKNVVLVTAGFRETENLKGEQELKEIAKSYGFRFMGPNCLGFQNTHAKYKEDSDDECILNFTWTNYQTEPGEVSIASQSGTFASHINFLMKERDLNMNKCLSIGNEADIDICDCLEYFEQDPNTKVILLYIEEIKRGRKFLDLVKRITPKKPIVALYVGGSEGGAKAVASHTGAIAGNDNIFNTLFKQTGVIRVYSIEELLDVGAALSKLVKINAIPRGNRLAIVTNSGGPGATMADLSSRLGLNIPTFSQELQNQLKKYLPHTAQSRQASNPLDYTFSIDPTTFFKTIPELLAKSGEVDGMVCYGAFGPAFFSYRNFGNEILKRQEIQKLIKLFTEMFEAAVDSAKRIPKKYKFPIFYINPIGYFKDDIIDFLNKKGFLVFRLPDQAIKTMYYIMRYGIFLEKHKIIK